MASAIGARGRVAARAARCTAAWRTQLNPSGCARLPARYAAAAHAWQASARRRGSAQQVRRPACGCWLCLSRLTVSAVQDHQAGWASWHCAPLVQAAQHKLQGSFRLSVAHSSSRCVGAGALSRYVPHLTLRHCVRCKLMDQSRRRHDPAAALLLLPPLLHQHNSLCHRSGSCGGRLAGCPPAGGSQRCAPTRRPRMRMHSGIRCTRRHRYARPARASMWGRCRRAGAQQSMGQLQCSLKG